MSVETKVALDTLWVVLAACLVFFMNAGFGMLETGFCRAKNAVNILAKNFVVFSVSAIAFWAVGFALMFGDGNFLFGTSGWFLVGPDNSPMTDQGYTGVFSSLAWAGVPLTAKFFFQLAFAATAATIVSGAVAERIKFGVFIVFSFLLVAFVYPIGGHWVWGGGWLSELGFADFAGSTVVHSVGGWAALMGAIFLGAREGKFAPDGTPRALPGHNLSFATLGTFILWLGWFGFNAGSTMAADPEAISVISVNTLMAAASGCLMATITAWLVLGKPDLSMILNGTLAGLVAITAPCDSVSIASSVLIGMIGGALVVFAVLFFDWIRVDDPVGAISVHLVNGVWGTLAVGLFASGSGLFVGGGFRQFFVQLAGIITIGLLVVAFSSMFWLGLKLLVGIRVSAAEEREGLDLGEHGMEAYPGFAQMPAEPELLEIR
ncbi:MAG: ammonium transporter [Acidobacteriota bacterium]|nr:MAG: ammonium transporter [Acidobacteriota bacterium]